MLLTVRVHVSMLFIAKLAPLVRICCTRRTGVVAGESYQRYCRRHEFKRLFAGTTGSANLSTKNAAQPTFEAATMSAPVERWYSILSS